MRSPRVGISNLAVPARVNKNSQDCIPHYNDEKPSADVQNDTKHTVSRAKRQYNEQEFMFSGLQASKTFNSQCGRNVFQRNPTEGVQNPLEIATITFSEMVGPRDYIKRKAESYANTESKYEPTFLGSAMRTTQLAAHMSDKGVVEQFELMEVGVSEDLPFVSHLEATVVNNEPSKVTVIFEELRLEYYELQASATPNVVVQVEPMETHTN